MNTGEPRRLGGGRFVPYLDGSHRRSIGDASCGGERHEGEGPTGMCKGVKRGASATLVARVSALGHGCPAPLQKVRVTEWLDESHRSKLRRMRRTRRGDASIGRNPCEISG